MDKLNNLARLFAAYNIYPKKAINVQTAFRVYQRERPDDYYVRQMESILQAQPEESTQRGADLPWWGQFYFDKSNGKRTMVISQDSLSPDAGSIVFYACYMPTHTSAEVSRWVKNNQLNPFRSWEKAKRLLGCLIEWDLTYITDAAKVYKNGSWNDQDFDVKKSRELLWSEIDICNPDLIILLGGKALELLGFEEVYSQVVGQRVLQKRGRNFIIAPFPSNANANGYEARMQNTQRLVREWVEGT